MFRLYNSLTQKNEQFQPEQPTQVKMYTCGPSTYQQAHIGNYRTFLFEDVLQRYLEFLGYKVIRVMTLTDIEDKALQQARKEHLSLEELTIQNEEIFFKDFELLKIKKPDYPIKASKAVEQAFNLVSALIEKGYAYIHNYKGEKNVYFEPLKFKGFGKLSRLNMEKWPIKKRRFHKDTYPGTPWNRGDFVIWRGCHPTNSCFKTLIGYGRPAWNIQDAAIVTKTLGYTIDLACGGIDNLVRHHDYTLATVEAASGKIFCSFWIHGAHLLVDGKKMSKSKGNVYYTNHLLEKSYTGEQIRFFLIYGHYREKLNFTFEGINESTKKLETLKKMVKDLCRNNICEVNLKKQPISNVLVEDFMDSMNSDLNVKVAFDRLYEQIQKIHSKKITINNEDFENIISGLHRIDEVFQCIF